MTHNTLYYTYEGFFVFPDHGSGQLCWLVLCWGHSDPGHPPAPAFSFSSLCYLATVPSSCGGLLRPAEVIFQMWLFGRRRGAGIKPRPSPELIVRVNSILWKFILRNFDKFIGKLLFSFSIIYQILRHPSWDLNSSIMFSEYWAEALK